MTRLAEKENIKNTQHSKDGMKKKKTKKPQSRKTQTAQNQKTEADTEKAQVSTDPSLIQTDVNYAVMFTSPPAYYIGRPINVSRPPEGEHYVMKFLSRGSANTYALPV